MMTNVDQEIFINQKFQPEKLANQKTVGTKCLLVR